MMQLDEAKSYLLLYFARAFAVNREVCSEENRAIILSRVPLGYKLVKGFDERYKFSEYMGRVLS